MRLFLVFLILSATQLSAQSSDNSPLTDGELRQVHGYLLELQGCRKELKAYELYVQRELDLDARQKTVSDREMELERDATANAKQQAEFWKQAYQTVTKKPGVGCILKRIFTLGIARCM